MKRYAFYSSDEELENFLDTKANISDFVEKTIIDVKDGKLNYSKGDLDTEIKIARLSKLQSEAIIKKFQATEIEKNTKTPSYSGHKPIEVTTNPNFSSVTLPEIKNEKTFLPIDQIDPVTFLDFLRKINDEWVLKCKFCGNNLTDLDREKVLKEYARHLKAIHEAEIKKYYGIE